MEQTRARQLLKQMLGPGAEFRGGQWEAIDQIANQRQRLLVVQRTGCGKSIVYFLATKILRDSGAAMGRNKLIYGLGEFAVVVSSDHQSGGTWAGAVEALKANWCPVLVRDGDGVPRGNKELLKLGATALPGSQLPEISNLAEWVQQHAPAKARESELFDSALRERAK